MMNLRLVELFREVRLLAHADHRRGGPAAPP